MIYLRTCCIFIGLDDPTTNSQHHYTSTETIRKHYFRNRYSTRTPIVFISTSKGPTNLPLRQSNYDQASESSNQQSNDGNLLGDNPITLHEVQEALQRNKHGYSNTVRLKTRLIRPVTSTARVPIVVTAQPPTSPRITTHFPTTTTTRVIFKKKKSQNTNNAFQSVNPVVKMIKSSYDENFSGLLSALPDHSKVLIDSSGVIKCLDQGNFPHPVSCKKFISCAKMEGKVFGWEYTCPKNLSFDPIGGMCNWSADLGCDE